MSKYPHFFSKDEQAQILTAIQAVEISTSGEVRVHLEDHCDHHPKDRAAYIFEQLQMHRTRERNGVLFYFSVCDQDFAVIGDLGIHEKVGEGYWSEICSSIEQQFRQGNYADGLVKAIAQVGKELQSYFPSRADDSNELDDAISMGGIQ